MNDRMKLAEAMGWKFDRSEQLKNSSNDKFRWTDLQGRKCTHGPDPFTDANDDYAVLEWMRKNGGERMPDDFPHQRQSDYKIGNYARAALKVLDDE